MKGCTQFTIAHEGIDFQRADVGREDNNMQLPDHTTMVNDAASWWLRYRR